MSVTLEERHLTHMARDRMNAQIPMSPIQDQHSLLRQVICMAPLLSGTTIRQTSICNPVARLSEFKSRCAQAALSRPITHCCKAFLQEPNMPTSTYRMNLDRFAWTKRRVYVTSVQKSSGIPKTFDATGWRFTPTSVRTSARCPPACITVEDLHVRTA